MLAVISVLCYRSGLNVAASTFEIFPIIFAILCWNLFRPLSLYIHLFLSASVSQTNEATRVLWARINVGSLGAERERDCFAGDTATAAIIEIVLVLNNCFARGSATRRLNPLDFYVNLTMSA